jgi:hypothetical protein
MLFHHTCGGLAHPIEAMAMRGTKSLPASLAAYCLTVFHLSRSLSPRQCWQLHWQRVDG